MDNNDTDLLNTSGVLLVVISLTFMRFLGKLNFCIIVGESDIYRIFVMSLRLLQLANQAGRPSTP